MKSILTFLSVILLLNLTSCDNQPKTKTEDTPSNFDYSGVVQEVIQTSNYTYCFVKDDKNESWVAITKMDLAVGQTLYFDQGMEMIDFHSKELDRTFPSVFFIQKASTNPNGDAPNQQPMGQQPVKPEIENKNYDVEKADDGITIAELYENKADYAGKKVRIRGKVTKFNTAIMSKNWAHIQDGSDFNGDFDLTVTTVDEVNVDAVVTFEGTIALDKDFGHGYFYPVLLEDAVIIK